MTGARRQRKQAARFAAAFAVCAACLTYLAAPGGRAGAQTSEMIVVDELRGLAIGGFDPVAYFAEGRPALGDGNFEYRHAGTVWRFCNEGNRAAFIANPEVYTPAFGGYDPVSIGLGTGTATAGNPMIWAIKAQRLFLF